MLIEHLTHPYLLKGAARGAVLALGNFDGVHKGHHALLETAKKLAAEQGKPWGVLTFEPHPRHFFAPQTPAFRITPGYVKLERLAAHKPDVIVTLPFDEMLAHLPAKAFIEDVLVSGLGAGHVVVGPDFHFGHLRGGSPQTLEQSDLPTTILPYVSDGDTKVSSTLVRQLLGEGDVARANEMLGWDWYIEGMVVKGDQRGTAMGFPTANVRLDRTVHPAYGIYASYVQIEGEDTWRAAATNIGIRPMFEVSEALVEAHILDFTGDIYGKTVRVKPVKRLRGEEKYENLEALIKQIAIDCSNVRKALA